MSHRAELFARDIGLDEEGSWRWYVKLGCQRANSRTSNPVIKALISHGVKARVQSFLGW